MSKESKGQRVSTHGHTSSVLPWPNGMSFTLAEFIAVAERRLTEAHEEVRGEDEPSFQSGSEQDY